MPQINNNRREISETILTLIHRLEEDSIPIIVEGKKDKEALETLYFGQIFTLSKSPLYEVAETVAKLPGKRACILTDLDKEGKKLYAALAHHLARLGITIDNELRHYLLRKTKLSHIEGIKTYLEGLENHHRIVE